MLNDSKARAWRALACSDAQFLWPSGQQIQDHTSIQHTITYREMVA